jgi:hypothetical protein
MKIKTFIYEVKMFIRLFFGFLFNLKCKHWEYDSKGNVCLYCGYMSDTNE